MQEKTVKTKKTDKHHLAINVYSFKRVQLTTSFSISPFLSLNFVNRLACAEEILCIGKYINNFIFCKRLNWELIELQQKNNIKRDDNVHDSNS